MKPLRHQRIIANAGSGKTYRLTTRYIELLARGVVPEKIIALTFTRKAAGEFLDAIFHRLVRASTDPAAASRLGGEVGFPTMSCEDFRSQLAILIDRMPQLALGTMDGFFGRIVRAFPFECGLAGELILLDQHQQELARRLVLAEIFRLHAASEKSFQELLSLLRKQGRNRQSRAVVATLDAEIKTLHEKYLITPRSQVWGEVDAVWPGGPPFTEDKNLGVLIDELEAALEEHHGDMDDKYRPGWEKRFVALRTVRRGLDVPTDIMNFALRSFENCLSKPLGKFEVKLGNKPFRLPDEMRFPVERLCRSILAIELSVRLERSRALHSLVAKFEEAYQSSVRQAGRLTFLDITGLLAATDEMQWAGKALGPWIRQAIDYRLDASYDHWLLDEFQDTSRLQWQAIRGLVDEVIQSDSGRRSFFYVGDTKQAIYSWRGGDPRLFDEISSYYNGFDGDQIDTSESLATSYRSAPEVLELVNTLFQPANVKALQNDLELPDVAVRRWESAWRDHQPSGIVGNGGYFSWRTFQGGELSSAELLDLETARLLTEIDPIRRGWSCAVLVRTNARIASVVNALRQAGLPAAAEGRFFPCVDNELGTAALALLQLLAHPEDTLARLHVEMTPLRMWLPEWGRGRLEAMHLLRERGYLSLMRRWLEDVPKTEFLKNRYERLIEAAAQFDQANGGQATIDEFIAYAEGYTTSEVSTLSAIRVMTVYASKGLDFDVVVLPELEGVALPSRRDDASIHLHVDASARVQWGLEMPPKTICALDPILSQAYEDDVAEDCYEKMCVYYVALTRAKKALYLLTSEQKEDTKSRDFNRWLHLTLPPEAREGGNATWFLSGVPKEENEAAFTSEISFQFERSERSVSLRPSQQEGRISAQWLLEDHADRGVTVHHDLSKKEWATEEDSPFLREVFARPEVVHALWIEQPFDVFLDGERVSGVFDRVVISPDEVLVLDFKTDRVSLSEMKRRHEAQLTLYRRALATLINRPLREIRARLVALSHERIIDFP